jgi:hypothetical protein
MSTILPPPPAIPMDVLLLVVEEQLSDLHVLCGGVRLSPSSSATIRPAAGAHIPSRCAPRSSPVGRGAPGLDEEDTHGSAESADRTSA